jgi:hypothetical protein
MEQDKIISGGLIGWLCFVGFVTRLDWLGFLILFSSGLSLAARLIIYAVVAICAAVAVLRMLRNAPIQRTILALSLVWLLVLPYIPWDETKVMATLSGFLVPGMTKAQVQSIMSAYPGVHDRGNRGTFFCTEQNWTYSNCEQIVTLVFVRMKDDKLQSVEIDWD